MEGECSYYSVVQLGIRPGGIKDLQLAYAPSCPGCLVHSQRILDGVGVLDKVMNGGRDIRKGISV